MRIDFPVTNSPESFLKYTEDPLYAGACLSSGSLLFYPTETFYALGCKSSDRAAIENIIKLKRRPPQKSLPLIAADIDQAASFCDLANIPADLLSTFWPGPLTLILPARKSLHSSLVSKEGKIAIRVSSSPLARSLARQSGEAIISSSANISGHSPVKFARMLDPGLLEDVRSARIMACILTISHDYQGEKPTTIAEALSIGGKCCLRILRSGAITEKMLEEKNFTLIS